MTHSNRIQGLRAQYLLYGMGDGCGIGTFIRSLLFQDGFTTLESLSLTYENVCSLWSRPLTAPLGGGLASFFPRLETLTTSGIEHLVGPYTWRAVSKKGNRCTVAGHESTVIK